MQMQPLTSPSVINLFLYIILTIASPLTLQSQNCQTSNISAISLQTIPDPWDWRDDPHSGYDITITQRGASPYMSLLIVDHMLRDCFSELLDDAMEGGHLRTDELGSDRYDGPSATDLGHPHLYLDGPGIGPEGSRPIWYWDVEQLLNAVNDYIKLWDDVGWVPQIDIKVLDDAGFVNMGGLEIRSPPAP